MFNYSGGGEAVVEPSLKCIRATVTYMRSACLSTDGCAVLCDLMSTACTSQMYIVAAAHCAANNNQPPK